MNFTSEELEQYRKHGINTIPKYHGQAQNQGELIPQAIFENEGYALLTCGKTSVKLSYTILDFMSGWLSIGVKGSFAYCNEPALFNAFHAICCEAAEGCIPQPKLSGNQNECP